MLRLLSRIQNRSTVLEFMRREFGTTMVKDLDFPELYRVGKYIEAVIRRQDDASKSGGNVGERRE